MRTEKLQWAAVIGGCLVFLWVAYQGAVAIYGLYQFQKRAEVAVLWFEQVIQPQIVRALAAQQAAAVASPTATPQK